MDAPTPVVQVDLPPSWVRVPVARDGDRAAQRDLLTDWCGGPPPADLVRRLTRESRRASAAGLSFSAVLLATVGSDVQRVAVTGSLTLGFRSAPGDPRVVAEGVLEAVRRAPRATRRAELVGLAGDATRPAVLVQEQSVVEGELLARAELLWPVAGQLAGVCVSTAHLPLGGAMRDLAARVAAGLSVSGVAPVNA